MPRPPEPCRHACNPESQTSQAFASKNNKRDTLIVNAEGSVNLYFGPKVLAGKEESWIQTIPRRG